MYILIPHHCESRIDNLFAPPFRHPCIEVIGHAKPNTAHEKTKGHRVRVEENHRESCAPEIEHLERAVAGGGNVETADARRFQNI